MKKLFIFLVAAALLGCATSGRIVETLQFVDSKYPISMKFPVKYDLRTSGQNAIERVTAVRYLQESEIIRGLMLLKPVFVVSVFPSDQPFADFIKDQSNKHFDFKYYFKYAVDNEADRTCSGYQAHLIFFRSQVATAGDYMVSIRGDNQGITAFVDAQKFFIKIEYIANKENYSNDDFRYVIDNLRIM